MQVPRVEQFYFCDDSQQKTTLPALVQCTFSKFYALWLGGPSSQDKTLPSIRRCVSVNGTYFALVNKTIWIAHLAFSVLAAAADWFCYLANSTKYNVL